MVHRTGRLFSGLECETIYEKYRTGDYPDFNKTPPADDSPAEILDAAGVHVEKIIKAIDADAIRAARIKIAIDSINGAGAMVFPLLLQRLQVAWEGVHTGTSGDFTHNPEPRPEHLVDLAALLRSRDDFWAGFAFDPDADRLAPMGEKGQPLSEELTLALSLQTVLSRSPSPIATNLSTTMMIDDVAKKFNVAVLRRKIGEANVVEAMLKHGCLIGGEGNGGVIFPEVSTVRDGFTAMGLILELMAHSREKISTHAQRLPSYPIVKVKIPLNGKDPVKAINALADKFAGEKTDRQDGLKIIREYGWVHIRPSNTEPIMRCYAEAGTQQQAEALVRMITEAI
jgi:phosphomannomutase